MKKINLESVYVIGEIKAFPPKIEKILSDYFTFHYLPDCKITNKKAEVFVIESPSVKQPCKINYPSALLRPDSDERSFVVVTEYLIERKRQENFGVCSINSSSVYRSNEAILFIGGETNLGKTSCALELAQKSDFTLFSDEKTLVDLERKVLCGGSRSVTLKKEIIKRKFVEDEEFIKIPFKYGHKPKVKIVILPHIDHGLEKPVIQKFDSLDLFWILTKEFCRRIRGDTKFINYYEYLLPSIDTEELAQKRVELTREFTKKVDGYYFQGSLDQLVEFINKI